jgi:hypothetical protein
LWKRTATSGCRRTRSACADCWQEEEKEGSGGGRGRNRARVGWDSSCWFFIVKEASVSISREATWRHFHHAVQEEENMPRRIRVGGLWLLIRWRFFLGSNIMDQKMYTLGPSRLQR